MENDVQNKNNLSTQGSLSSIPMQRTNTPQQTGQQTHQTENSWTPMGHLYSPYPSDKSPTTPLNISTPTSLSNMDWPSPKSTFASAN